MNERIDPELLRESFLEMAAASDVSQVLGIAVSLMLAGTVVWLVYRRKLLEEYTPIWLMVSAAILVVSLRRDVLGALARASGAWSYSSILFFLGEVFLVMICLNFAVRLSSMGVQIKKLGQEVALLKERQNSPEVGVGGSERARGVAESELDQSGVEGKQEARP